jgi:hypothetical protein
MPRGIPKKRAAKRRSTVQIVIDTLKKQGLVAPAVVSSVHQTLPEMVRTPEPATIFERGTYGVMAMGKPLHHRRFSTEEDAMNFARMLTPMFGRVYVVKLCLRVVPDTVKVER